MTPALVGWLVLMRRLDGVEMVFDPQADKFTRMLGRLELDPWAETTEPPRYNPRPANRPEEGDHAAGRTLDAVRSVH